MVTLLAACGGETTSKGSDGKADNAVAPVTAVASPPTTPSGKPSPEDSYASDTSPAELNMRFQALGTEPFWSVKVGVGTATYTTPEDQEGTPARYDFTFEKDTLRYAWKQDARSFVLVTTKGTCSDGMSDTVYEWKAALTVDGKTEQGCARLK